MSKQYHFWPGDAGLDAWDVGRLIRLAADLPVSELPVTAIWEIDTEYWFDALHRPTVRSVIDHARLIAAADLSCPILLGQDGRVMDGMHRVGRALLEGASTILARQFRTPIAPDYRNCRPEDLRYD